MIVPDYFYENTYGIDDHKINKISFESNKDEFKNNMVYDINNILFHIEYNIKPSNTESYNNYGAENSGDGNDGWIVDKSNTVSTRKDKHGYYYIHSIEIVW